MEEEEEISIEEGKENNDEEEIYVEKNEEDSKGLEWEQEFGKENLNEELEEIEKEHWTHYDPWQV